MVSVVLHNAALRMEEEGAGIDEILAPKGIGRWLGRGGLAFGGAASLLVGAIFGGILEGVPVLLPPPAAASASPTIDSGGGALPANTFSLASLSAPAPVTAAVAAVTSSLPTGGNFPTVPTPTLPSPVPLPLPTPVQTQLPTQNSQGPSGTTDSGPTGSTTPPPSSSSPLSGVEGTVTQTVQTVEGAVAPVVSTVTGALGGSTSNSSNSSLGSTVDTVVNGVTGTVNGLTSGLGL